MNKSSPTNVSALDEHLGFWLRFVSNQVSSRFEKLLTECEISVAEWVAMRTLYERPTTTHAELINALGMTKGAASKVITKLESKKLAERQFSENNAKEQILILSATGKKLTPKLAALADANDQFFFGHLEKSQADLLMSMMQDLVSYHKLKEIPIK